MFICHNGIINIVYCSVATGEEDILSMEHSKQSLENYQMGEACRKASTLIRDFTINYDERVVSRQVKDFRLIFL